MSREQVLESEIAAIATELGSMPLMNSNRNRRLELNRQRGLKEAELAQLREQQAIEAQIAGITKQLALEATLEGEKRGLQRRLRALEADLQALISRPRPSP